MAPIANRRHLKSNAGVDLQSVPVSIKKLAWICNPCQSQSKSWRGFAIRALIYSNGFSLLKSGR